MSVCKPNCVTTIPNNDWVNGCNITTRPGGITRLTFLKCDPNMELPYTGGWENVANVQWALCNGFLYVTGPILGKSDKATFTKKKISSCEPEIVISGQKTISWQDFNADEDDLLDFDFYQGIKDNVKFMLFGWIDCNELWYRFDGDWSIEVDSVTDDSKEGNTFYDGVITMLTKDIIKPIRVVGILDALEALSSEDCYAYIYDVAA